MSSDIEDEDYVLRLETDFEGSDDDGDYSQEDIEPSDSEDSDYKPSESDSEEDTSDELSEETVSGSEGSDASATPASTCHLLSNPFGDNRPLPLPTVQLDFDDVHPELIVRHESHPFSAFECFKLFMTDEVIQFLVRCTNARADIFFRDNPTKSRKKFMGKNWTDVTEDEMYVFISLVLLMGLDKLPRISDYWSNSLLTRGSPVFTAAVMSRNRFNQIMRFLRFGHPDDVVRRKPMSRLDQYFQMLQEKCMLYVSAGENFAVDESLILYKGRLHFRQFIKTKRKRYGLKLFALCPSAPVVRGYTWNFCLYTPTVYTEMMADPVLAGLSKSERVPVFLMKGLLNKGRHVVLDNWYSSAHLAEYLLDKNTLTTGTIRQDRGVPDVIRRVNLKKSQSVFGREGVKLFVKYNDRGVVHVITTKYEAGYAKHTRFLKGGKQEIINRPLHIERYNEQMGSVDLVDQLLEPYEPTRKSYCWFKKLGIHMITRMVLNARVVYQILHNVEVNIEYFEFLKTVIHEMLYEHSFGYINMVADQEDKPPPKKKQRTRYTPPTNPQPSTSADSPPISFHGLVNIPVTETSKKRPQRRCRVCSSEKKTKWCRKYCPGCPEKPGLCSLEHYQAWHRQKSH